MTQKDKYYQLIMQYVRGDLQVEDRHDIEKQALDDPFFFDALEGWMSLEENDQHKKHISLLLQKIHGKKKESLVRRIIWPVAIAASLILFFTIGNILVDRNDQSLASTTPDEANSEIAVSKEQTGISEPEIIAQEPGDTQEEVPAAIEEQPAPITSSSAEKPDISRDLADNKKKAAEPQADINEVATADNVEIEDVASMKQVEPETVPASKTEARKRVPLSVVNESLINNMAQNDMALTAGILEIIDPDLDDHIRKNLFMRNLKVFPGVRNSYEITFDSTLNITVIKLISRKNDLSDYIQEFILKYEGWKKETIPPNLQGQYHYPPKQK